MTYTGKPPVNADNNADDRVPEEFALEVYNQREMLLRFAMSLHHTKTNAEDLVSLVTIKALQNWQRFEPGTNLKAWLRTITKNENYSANRKSWRTKEDPDDFLSRRLAIQPEQDSGLSMEAIWRALAQLSVEHRSTIDLMMAGHQIDEIAALLNIPDGTVKSRIHRARVILATFLPLEDTASLPRKSFMTAAIKNKEKAKTETKTSKLIKPKRLRRKTRKIAPSPLISGPKALEPNVLSSATPGHLTASADATPLSADQAQPTIVKSLAPMFEANAADILSDRRAIAPVAPRPRKAGPKAPHKTL